MGGDHGRMSGRGPLKGEWVVTMGGCVSGDHGRVCGWGPWEGEWAGPWEGE